MSRNEDQFDPCAPINSLPCTLLRLHLRTVCNVHGGIAETEIYRVDIRAMSATTVIATRMDNGRYNK